MTRFKRAAGSLLHITSLPSRYGIGSLGKAAYDYIDFLHASGLGLWQICPIGPTGAGNSPYSCYSSFAGNPLFIDLDILQKQGFLQKKDLETDSEFRKDKTEYGKVKKFKNKVFKKAYKNFHPDKQFEQFCDVHDMWLDNYALFMALKNKFEGKPWQKWHEEIKFNKPEARKKYQHELKDEILFHKFLQFQFYQQWGDMYSYAQKNNVKIIGDIPIYVTMDSADAWANPELFQFDENLEPTRVAGVPPDYFSKTGQLWGNPLYDWERMEKNGFAWWLKRIKHLMKLIDIIRIDHFIGFVNYWSVPAEDDTAVNGKWIEVPTIKFFNTVKKELGTLPIIAEDLGVMTPSVEDLRDSFNFPGMKILQFAFDSDSENAFLPHNYSQNSVTYTGTHDNDTTIGWYQSAPEVEKHRMREYTRSDGSQPEWELIRLGMLSVADQAIFPLQDYMGLGTEHRMNLPATVGDNWLWRYTPDMLRNIDEAGIKKMVEMGNRKPRPSEG